MAVGGGSVIDCAKGIAIISNNGGHILDYEGVDSVEKPMPPLICIPTTAGSSADVSQFAIITDTNRKVKIAIISKTIIPDVSLIDPMTTTTMDVSLTVYTGMDALCHAFESFASNANSPITDLFALKSIEIIYSNLHKVVKNLKDVEIRSSMMLGSLYAGLAFSNASLGLVHAMAHSAGGLLNLPHGCCNTNLLPYVVAYNFDAIPLRYREIARQIGIDEKDLDDKTVCEELINSIFNLIQKCGIQTGLCQTKFEGRLLEQLADNALKDPCLATNPKIPTKEEIINIYARAN
ncbi:MAG: iron-containing alcohol dehydrogenase [Thermodesulfovibrionales bacterium]|nr:iron-containing alcohol dehydrogenase [Thermodesulfovibrionales bacterium]